MRYSWLSVFLLESILRKKIDILRPLKEGDMYVQPGDWVITGIKGEVYPCKDDIFRATYEPVEEDK